MTNQITNDLAIHTINKIQLVLKDTFSLLETRDQAVEVTHLAIVNLLHTILALSGWEEKSPAEIEKAAIHYCEQAALTYLRRSKIYGEVVPAATAAPN